MSKTNQETLNSPLMTSDNGFWFFIPDRDTWNKFGKSDLDRDIELENILDEIELFEVGANYES